MRKLFFLSTFLFIAAFTVSSCKSESTTTTTETTTTENEVMVTDTTMSADTAMIDTTINDVRPTARPNQQ